MAQRNQAYNHPDGLMSVDAIERNELGPLRGMPQQVKSVLYKHRSRAFNIAEDKQTPAEGKREMTEVSRNAGRAEMLGLGSKAAEHAQTAREDLAVVKRQHGANLDSGAHTVAWNRVRGLLDSGVDVAEIVRAAEQRGDRATIAVLRDELYAYSWGKTGEQAHAARVFESVAPELDNAEYSMADAEWRRAHDLQAELESGMARLGFGLHHGYGEVNDEDGDHETPAVPAWSESDGVYDVGDPAADAERKQTRVDAIKSKLGIA